MVCPPVSINTALSERKTAPITCAGHCPLFSMISAANAEVGMRVRMSSLNKNQLIEITLQILCLELLKVSRFVRSLIFYQSNLLRCSIHLQLNY